MGFTRCTIPQWLTLQWLESRKCKGILEHKLSITVSPTSLSKRSWNMCCAFLSSEPRTNFDAVFWTFLAVCGTYRAKSETSVTATSARTSRLALHQPHIRFLTIGLAINQGGSCVAWGNTHQNISSQNFFPFPNTDLEPLQKSHFVLFGFLNSFNCRLHHSWLIEHKRATESDKAYEKL